MSEEPENLVLQLLRGMRAEVAESRSSTRRSTRATNSALRARSIRCAPTWLASDIATMQKETREQIVGLRRAVIEYHSSVVGHGLLISEHEERIRRLEQRLNLPPLKAS